MEGTAEEAEGGEDEGEKTRGKSVRKTMIVKECKVTNEFSVTAAAPEEQHQGLVSVQGELHRCRQCTYTTMKKFHMKSHIRVHTEEEKKKKKRVLQVIKNKMMTFPLASLFHGLVIVLLSALGIEEMNRPPALTRVKAVRLSAHRNLAPMDPHCDTKGREGKFCLRQGKEGRDWQLQGVCSPVRSESANVSSSLGADAATSSGRHPTCPKASVLMRDKCVGWDERKQVNA
ncbi:hypothetical protein HPB50_011462 [Hyalomma asiaticum]|uniref:Uncharacterized protein n=1 Tax=Hyalomma asiaticum TaxID=266040 RepID=A0ACB7RKC8_HYAAI|nr:hypothetical protein HPB50_011462 [Hyalomma asiaticum]